MRNYQAPFQKQEQFSEDTLSAAKARTEMQGDIDFANKRVNVDSAKKLAVMQHMDYDGFRQMVLGANLKPMKKGQIE